MEMSNGDGGHHSSSPESPGARPSATKREGREKSEREKRTYR